MRTITQNQLERLKLQADEADTQGFRKVADHLTDQIQVTKIRKDGEFYSYSSEELKNDVENNLWASALRVADYFNTTLDAVEVQKVIEVLASELINNLTNLSDEKVGAHEPKLPGEKSQHMLLEVLEKE